MELKVATVLGDNDTTFNEHDGPDECDRTDPNAWVVMSDDG